MESNTEVKDNVKVISAEALLRVGAKALLREDPVRLVNTAVLNECYELGSLIFKTKWLQNLKETYPRDEIEGMVAAQYTQYTQFKDLQTGTITVNMTPELDAFSGNCFSLFITGDMSGDCIRKVIQTVAKVQSVTERRVPMHLDIPGRRDPRLFTAILTLWGEEDAAVDYASHLEVELDALSMKSVEVTDVYEAKEGAIVRLYQSMHAYYMRADYLRGVYDLCQSRNETLLTELLESDNLKVVH